MRRQPVDQRLQVPFQVRFQARLRGPGQIADRSAPERRAGLHTPAAASGASFRIRPRLAMTLE
jgi:hypothetical protein